MSVFGIPTGIPRTARKNLSGTSATTIVSASERSNIYVVGILLVNNSGGSLTPIVDVYDGTNAFALRDNTSLADTAREVVTLPEFIWLQRGDLLRVTANTGLKVFASYIEVPTTRAVSNGA